MDWNQVIISVFSGAIIPALVFIGAIFTYREKINGLRRDVDRIENKIDRVETKLDQHIQNIIVTKMSPLSLTPYAVQLLKDINFESKIFPDIRDILLAELEKHELRTAYDVQEMARYIVKRKRDDILFDDLKKSVYETGNNLDEVLSAIFIPLRDYYLAKHTDLTS